MHLPLSDYIETIPSQYTRVHKKPSATKDAQTPYSVPDSQCLLLIMIAPESYTQEKRMTFLGRAQAVAMATGENYPHVMAT